MNILGILAKLVGGWLIGWVEQRIEARKQQAVKDKVIRDDQTIANQNQTIEVEQARNEIERQDGALPQKSPPNLATAPADSVDGELRDIGAIRPE